MKAEHNFSIRLCILKPNFTLHKNTKAHPVICSDSNNQKKQENNPQMYSTYEINEYSNGISIDHTYYCDIVFCVLLLWCLELIKWWQPQIVHTTKPILNIYTSSIYTNKRQVELIIEENWLKWAETYDALIHSN